MNLSEEEKLTPLETAIFVLQSWQWHTISQPNKLIDTKSIPVDVTEALELLTKLHGGSHEPQ